MSNIYEFPRPKLEEIDQSNIEPPKKSNRAKKIGAAVLAGIIIGSGIAFIVNETNKSLSKDAALIKNLHDPKALRASGACVQLLGAEAKFLDQASKDIKTTGVFYDTNYQFESKSMYESAGYYAVAMNTAAANHVSCTPENPTLPSLTPDFSIVEMKKDHSCASTLESQFEDVEKQPNNLYKEGAIVNNDKLIVEIALAQEFNISC